MVEYLDYPKISPKNNEVGIAIILKGHLIKVFWLLKFCNSNKNLWYLQMAGDKLPHHVRKKKKKPIH